MFPRLFTEGPGVTQTWPGLPKAGGQNGERGRLGATGPGFKSSSNTSCWWPLPSGVSVSPFGKWGSQGCSL